MTKEVLFSLAGAVVGFLLTYFTKTYENLIKAGHIKSALLSEALFAKSKIEGKLLWLSRDCSKHLAEVDKKRIASFDGKKLFLGEKENFEVNCRYWKEKYSEIAEFLNEKDFKYFQEVNQFITDFGEKFIHMKQAFETKYGNPNFMSVACYRDLLQINNDLGTKLAERQK